MTLSMAAVTFDCRNAAELAQFWSKVLERPVDDGASEFFASIGLVHGQDRDQAGRTSPALMFIQVPESKQVKNRVHLDFHTADRKAEIDRVVTLGAVHVADFEEHGFAWACLRDPAGNEFDIGKGPS
ncbi:MAG: VOC family protein [Dermatophilaceae bacterium]